ncbi:DUF4255 domain-containing protein [Vibrio sp. 10N]|uniref:DUF4255 domain-containing protein n=1 Tax=Vibrio sp. 10N TaxID=3058938 RepID=UPI0028140E23|nr:hypothetical protein VB10N_36170 [Vibrio sp. 10N]
MLDNCLEYLCQRINQSLHTTFDLSEDLAIVSAPSDSNKNSAGQNDNKVLIFLSGIERDPYSKPGQMAAFSSQPGGAITGKPLYLSISVVVASNFSSTNYTDGLKILSHVLAFFHRNPIFNRQNSPDMPEFVEQIGLEMDVIPEGQLSHMWSMLGSNYLPSCVYQVRVAIPNSDTLLRQAGRLSSIKPKLSNEV